MAVAVAVVQVVRVVRVVQAVQVVQVVQAVQAVQAARVGDVCCWMAVLRGKFVGRWRVRTDRHRQVPNPSRADQAGAIGGR